MTSRIPSLLEPYLYPPPESSLILLTGILGASTNWLALRFLHALTTAPDNEPATHVVLVSFLRDLAFWRDGAARLGLDLAKLGRLGRFFFVDGLSELFAPGTGPGPGEGEPRWTAVLRGAALGDVTRVLGAAVNAMSKRSEESEGDLGDGAVPKVVLMIDGLDLLLAAAGGEGDGDVCGRGLLEMMLDLREKSYSTIMTVSADEPLISSQTTMLEKEHASFVLSLAHEAEMILSLRLLDTGTAKDVSGVVRITRGGSESERAIEEKEYLYHVGGDGGVRVFERGQ